MKIQGSVTLKARLNIGLSEHLDSVKQIPMPEFNISTEETPFDDFG